MIMTFWGLQLRLTFEMYFSPTDACIRCVRWLIVHLCCQAMEQTIAKDGQKFRFLIDGFPRNADNLEGWNREMDGKADVKFVLFFDCSNEVRHAGLTLKHCTRGSFFRRVCWPAQLLSTGLHSEVFRQGEGKWANRRQQRKLGKKVKSNLQNPL